MANIAYIRVSTIDQNTARQEEALKPYNIDKYFIEKVSGKNIKDRPELKKMLEYIREGDVVYVESISRLGRSLSDLLELIDSFNNKGVNFCSIKEGEINTTTPTGKLVYSIFGALSEFERSCIRERQREGIDLAKSKGVYKGKPKKQLNANELISDYKGFKEGDLKKKFIAKKHKVSVSTIDRRFAEFEKQNKQGPY